MPDEPLRPPQKGSKKSEMIEVRVSWETKRDFLAACRSTGRTASEVVRASIDDFVRSSQRPLPETVPQPANDRTPFLLAIPKPIRRKRYLAAGAAVAGVALFAAFPSAAAPGLDATFKSLDANGDGALTIEEFSKKLPDALVQKSLRKLQQGGAQATVPDPANSKVYILLPDADGKAAAQLRAVNFTAVSGAPPVAMEDRRRADFANYDVNKDGKIDLGEYRARLGAMLRNGFGQLDKDSSGGLDPTEYQALSATVLAIPVDAITAFGTTGQYGPLMAPETLDAAFKARDANKDGKLSLEEYLPPA